MSPHTPNRPLRLPTPAATAANGPLAWPASYRQIHLHRPPPTRLPYRIATPNRATKRPSGWLELYWTSF